jgi:hypothetical protein
VIIPFITFTVANDNVFYHSQRLLASLVGFGRSSEMPNVFHNGLLPRGNSNSGDRAFYAKLACRRRMLADFAGVISLWPTCYWPTIREPTAS